jgi:hypothetical protein
VTSATDVSAASGSSPEASRLYGLATKPGGEKVGNGVEAGTRWRRRSVPGLLLEESGFVDMTWSEICQPIHLPTHGSMLGSHGGNCPENEMCRCGRKPLGGKVGLRSLERRAARGAA